jgi:hypothetical protein
MIDPNVLILIVGGLLLVLLIFVFPAIFQNRQARIARHFRRNKDIRFELIQSTSKNGSSLPVDLSVTEMVALLTVIAFRNTVSEGLASAQRFGVAGWNGKFNDEFFDKLNSTARAFASKRWNRDSIDLFRLGQMIAHANNNSHWSREFAESIQRLQYQQIQSGLPTKMK